MDDPTDLETSLSDAELQSSQNIKSPAFQEAKRRGAFTCGIPPLSTTPKRHSLPSKHPSHDIALLPVRRAFSEGWLEITKRIKSSPHDVCDYDKLEFRSRSLPNSTNRTCSQWREADATDSPSLRPVLAKKPLLYTDDGSDKGRERLQGYLERVEIGTDASPIYYDEEKQCWNSPDRQLKFLRKLEGGETIYSALEGQESHLNTSVAYETTNSLLATAEEWEKSGDSSRTGDVDRIKEFIALHTQLVEFANHPSFNILGAEDTSKQVSFLEMTALLDPKGNQKGKNSHTISLSRADVSSGVIRPSANGVRPPRKVSITTIPRSERERLVKQHGEANATFLSLSGQLGWAFAKMKLLPQEISAIELRHHLHGTPTGLHHSNPLHSTIQLNYTKFYPPGSSSDDPSASTNEDDSIPAVVVDEDGSLKLSIGIAFAANHADGADDPALWTFIIDLSYLPPGSDGGRFYDLRSGTYIEFNPSHASFYLFKGTNPHMGTAPRLPPTYSAPAPGREYARSVAVCYPFRLANRQDPPIAYDIEDIVSNHDVIQAGIRDLPLLGDGVGWNTVGGDDTARYLLTIHYARRSLESAWRIQRRLYVEEGLPPPEPQSTATPPELLASIKEEHRRFLLTTMDTVFRFMRDSEAISMSWESEVRRAAAIYGLEGELVELIVSRGNPFGVDGSSSLTFGQSRETRDRAIQQMEEVYSNAYSTHFPITSFHQTRPSFVKSRGWVQERVENSTKLEWRWDPKAVVAPPAPPTDYYDLLRFDPSIFEPDTIELPSGPMKFEYFSRLAIDTDGLVASEQEGYRQTKREKLSDEEGTAWSTEEQWQAQWLDSLRKSQSASPKLYSLSFASPPPPNLAREADILIARGRSSVPDTTSSTRLILPLSPRSSDNTPSRFDLLPHTPSSIPSLSSVTELGGLANVNNDWGQTVTTTIYKNMTAPLRRFRALWSWTTTKLLLELSCAKQVRLAEALQTEGEGAEVRAGSNGKKRARGGSIGQAKGRRSPKKARIGEATAPGGGHKGVGKSSTRNSEREGRKQKKKDNRDQQAEEVGLRDVDLPAELRTSGGGASDVTASFVDAFLSARGLAMDDSSAHKTVAWYIEGSRSRGLESRTFGGGIDDRPDWDDHTDEQEDEDIARADWELCEGDYAALSATLSNLDRMRNPLSTSTSIVQAQFLESLAMIGVRVRTELWKEATRRGAKLDMAGQGDPEEEMEKAVRNHLARPSGDPTPSKFSFPSGKVVYIKPSGQPTKPSTRGFNVKASFFFLDLLVLQHFPDVIDLVPPVYRGSTSVYTEFDETLTSTTKSELGVRTFNSLNEAHRRLFFASELLLSFNTPTVFLFPKIADAIEHSQQFIKLRASNRKGSDPFGGDLANVVQTALNSLQRLPEYPQILEQISTYATDANTILGSLGLSKEDGYKDVVPRPIYPAYPTAVSTAEIGSLSQKGTKRKKQFQDQGEGGDAGENPQLIQSRNDLVIEDFREAKKRQKKKKLQLAPKNMLDQDHVNSAKWLNALVLETLLYLEIVSLNDFTLTPEQVTGWRDSLERANVRKMLEKNRDKFLFLREAQPNRTHTKGIDRSDKTRVCTTALIMRGCVIGSSREVYEKVPPNGFDRESWQRFWDEVEAIPIPTNGQRVKIGDPHSYGSWTNINASHASSYFDNVNLLVTKLSGQGSPLPFSTVYNWLLKEKLKGGKRPFPNAAGPLIGGLLTSDLAYAGLCKMPTLEEMKRFIVDNDKGGARGLKAFGFGKAGEGDGWFEFARRVRGTWEKGGFCPIVRENLMKAGYKMEVPDLENLLCKPIRADWTELRGKEFYKVAPLVININVWPSL